MEIRKALAKKFPEATKIAKNEFGDWNVTFEMSEGWFEEIHTFAFSKGKLKHIGTTTFEY
jgi:hypothetical protein